MRIGKRYRVPQQNVDVWRNITRRFRSLYLRHIHIPVFLKYSDIRYNGRIVIMERIDHLYYIGLYVTGIPGIHVFRQNMYLSSPVTYHVDFISKSNRFRTISSREYTCWVELINILSGIAPVCVIDLILQYVEYPLPSFA